MRKQVVGIGKHKVEKGDKESITYRSLWEIWESFVKEGMLASSL